MQAYYELQRNGKILVLKFQIILKLVLSSDFFMEVGEGNGLLIHRHPAWSYSRLGVHANGPVTSK